MIDENDVAAYERDGVVCLRNQFDARWSDRLRGAVERDLASPGPNATNFAEGSTAGRFFGDMFMWKQDPDFRAAALESPAPAIAASHAAWGRGYRRHRTPRQADPAHRRHRHLRHDPAVTQCVLGPMAFALIGGLLVASALTLLFLPVLYGAWFRVKKPTAEAGQPIRHEPPPLALAAE